MLRTAAWGGVGLLMLLCVLCIGAILLGGMYKDILTYSYQNDLIAEIRIMDFRTGITHQLADRVNFDSGLVWSPDGNALLFTTNLRDNNTEIYKVDAGGNHLQNLTMNPAVDIMPAWSPDHQQIAFVSYRSGNNDIYLMDADGGNVQQITDYEGNDLAPEWSPTGDSIAFVRQTEDGVPRLMVYDVAAKTTITLTDATYTVRQQSLGWSPDATNLTFVSAWQLNTYQQSGEISTLTDETFRVWTPVWSPDSQQIAFVANPNDIFDIFVINADGSGLRNLTQRPMRDLRPLWSSDGKRILFLSRRADDIMTVFIMNADGSDLHRMTNFSGNTYAIAWRP